MKHATEEDLVLLYYGEDGVDRETSSHVEQCPDCRAAAAALASTLNLCDTWTVPDRPAQYERNVWNSLVPARGLFMERLI